MFKKKLYLAILITKNLIKDDFVIYDLEFKIVATGHSNKLIKLHFCPSLFSKGNSLDKTIIVLVLNQ